MVLATLPCRSQLGILLKLFGALNAMRRVRDRVEPHFRDAAAAFGAQSVLSLFNALESGFDFFQCIFVVFEQRRPVDSYDRTYDEEGVLSSDQASCWWRWLGLERARR